MENEIKVNDYVRIAGGIIARITNKNKDGLLIDRVTRDPMRQDGTIRDWCIFNNEKELIVKYSSNLIDLIQVGDYVNGYKVISIDRDVIDVHTDCIELDLNNNYQYNFITINQIKTIVTEEQMVQISYKVKEN